MTAGERASRLGSLDGLRGAAALAVVFYHGLITLLGFRGVPALPLVGILWNGHAAVIVFFVLSGLVLSLPYWRGTADGWAPFLVRRVFRIYPLFAFSVVIVPCLIVLVDAAGGSWRALPSWSELLSDLAMIDRPVDEALNGSAWTLIHEMRVSLIFPAIILFMRLAGGRALPIALGFSTIVPMVGDYVPYAWTASWFLTAHFLWLFVLGAEIARRLPLIRARFAGLAKPMGWTLLLILLTILGYDLSVTIGGIRIGLLIEAAAGGLVVCAIVLPGMARILESPPLHWLGRVSYSLYLIHGPVIAVAVALMPGHVPPIAAVAMGIVGSLLTAELLYRTIERPTMRFGRDLARCLAARRSVVDPAE